MMNLIKNKKKFEELINTLEKKIDLCLKDKDNFKKLTEEYTLIMTDNIDTLHEIQCAEYIGYHKYIDGYIESCDFQKAKNQLKSDLSYVKTFLKI